MSVNIDQSDPKAAYEYSILLLSIRNYSKYELFQKLSRKGFDTTTVEQTLKRLTELGLLDDKKYTEFYIRSHQDNYSRRTMQQKLLQRGIAEECFQDIYAHMEDELGFDPELGAMIKAVNSAIKKEAGRLKKEALVKASNEEDNLEDTGQICVSWEGKNRILASLFRKGYSISSVKSIVDQKIIVCRNADITDTESNEL